jgi:hypothetical protein
VYTLTISGNTPSTQPCYGSKARMLKFMVAIGLADLTYETGCATGSAPIREAGKKQIARAFFDDW